MVSSKLVCLLVALGVICAEARNIEKDGSLRIIGGTEAAPGEFPYLVQVRRSYIHRFACAGIIIAPKYVLTAGHCLTDIGRTMDIAYGTNRLANMDIIENSIPVVSRRIHPKYDLLPRLLPQYDVGILELEVALNYSATVQPIKLPEANTEIPKNAVGTLPGWGLSSTSINALSGNLLKTNLTVLSNTDCVDRMKSDTNFDNFPTAVTFCSDDRATSGCNGDSGGPFIIDNVPYGLFSWNAKPCGTSPGVYALLTDPEIRQFIKDVADV